MSPSHGPTARLLLESGPQKTFPKLLMKSGGSYEPANLEKGFSEDNGDDRRITRSRRPVIFIATARSLARGGAVGRQVHPVPSGDRAARATAGGDSAGAIVGGSGCEDQAGVELQGTAGGPVVGRCAQYSASAGRLQISRRVGGQFRAPGQPRLAGFRSLAPDLLGPGLFQGVAGPRRE